MIETILGVVASIITIIILFDRVLNALIDEEKNVIRDPEFVKRFGWLYKISEKAETVWPSIRSMDVNRWGQGVANIALFLVIAIIAAAGLFREFLISSAVPLGCLLIISLSLTNGSKSMKSYEEIKPYLPVLIPAMLYQFMFSIEKERPELAIHLTIPGHDFMETKLLVACLGFLLALILPYPLAKLDRAIFKAFTSATLNFTKDFMRLAVRPQNEVESAIRKVAKEMISLWLKIILSILGTMLWLSSKSQ